jgi:hypothetical protein
MSSSESSEDFLFFTRKMNTAKPESVASPTTYASYIPAGFAVVYRSNIKLTQDMVVTKSGRTTGIYCTDANARSVLSCSLPTKSSQSPFKQNHTE